MSNKGRLDFLDILLAAQDEDGSGLTDAEIRNEVDTFLFTGNNYSSCRLFIFFTEWCDRIFEIMYFTVQIAGHE